MVSAASLLSSMTRMRREEPRGAASRTLPRWWSAAVLSVRAAVAPRTRYHDRDPRSSLARDPRATRIMVRTRLRPMPKPPSERFSLPRTWVNRSKTVGSHGLDSRFLYCHPEDRLIAVGFEGQARCFHPLPYTSHCCSGGLTRPGPIGSGPRPPRSLARRNKSSRWCFLMSMRGRLVSTARATTILRSTTSFLSWTLPCLTRETSTRSSISRVICWT